MRPTFGLVLMGRFLNAMVYSVRGSWALVVGKISFY
jgi:hypothetical protein